MQLYELTENCDYGPLKEEMICDRLVVGIRDGPPLQRLQLNPDLMLERAKILSINGRQSRSNSKS